MQSQYMSKVAAFLAQSQSLAQNPFVVIDVGASGGLDLIWRQLEPTLRAYCFDPLVAEVERLNALERNSAVRYFDAWITCDDEGVLEGTKMEGLLNDQSFHLTSAKRAMTVMSLNFVQEHFNQGAELRYSENRYSVDTFCRSHPVPDFDFLKVDTDGHDYFVLRGAEQSLTEKMVLGVLVECQLHGTVHPHANTFANIDQFLRQQGFTLFDLDIWRYTREALPGNFYYDIPAQTTRGQVQWGDALYLVDPMTNAKCFQQLVQTQYHSKLIKLIALYTIFGLEDCAAELICCLEKHTIEIADIADINDKKLLNMLVPDNPWSIADYKEYISFFDQDPTQFYPSNSKKPEEIEQKKPPTKTVSMSLLARMSIGPAGTRDGDRVRTRRAVVGHVVFGPYVDLMPGRYRLTVVMETDLALLDVNLAALALAIEVVCGRYIAARYHLVAEDLQRSAHTLLFTIPDDFKDYFSMQKLECRIWTSGAVHAAITSITLDAADDELAPDTSDFDWLPLLQVGPAGARADHSHVWVAATPGKVGHVVFGPYVDLLPGSYRLCAEIAANDDSPLLAPKSQVPGRVRPLHQKLSHKLSRIGHVLLSGFKKSPAREAVAPLEIEVVTQDMFLTKVPIRLRRGVQTYEVSFSVSTEDFQRLPKGRLEFRLQSFGTVPWELRTLRLQRVE